MADQSVPSSNPPGPAAREQRLTAARRALDETGHDPAGLDRSVLEREHHDLRDALRDMLTLTDTEPETTDEEPVAESTRHTALQLDGWACIRCGHPLTHGASLPDGHVDGRQVFRCQICPPPGE